MLYNKLNLTYTLFYRIKLEPKIKKKMINKYYTTNPENGQEIEVEIEWLCRDEGIISVYKIYDTELSQFIEVSMKTERKIKEQILQDILNKKQDFLSEN